MADEDDELELEDEEEADKKPKPQPTPSKEEKEASIGKPIAPAMPTAMAPPDVDQLPLPTSTPPQGAVGSPINVAQPPARPVTPLPQYHGLNRVLDTLGGATRIGTAIEQASGLGTQGALARRGREQAAEAGEAGVAEKQALAEEAEARAKKTGKEAELVGQMSTVTGPHGEIIQIPTKDLEKYLGTQTTTGSREKIAGEEIGSREKIAQWNNETKTRIDALGEQVKKDIANLNAATGIKKENIKAGARVESAKIGAGKISPFIASEAKVYQDSYERLRTMQQNLDDALRDPQHPDQQAMLSLLAQHMGMTLGAIKGTRAGRQLIQEAEASAPFLGRIEAHFSDDGYLTGVVLTPEQMQSMVALGENRFKLDQERFHNMQQFAGQGGQGELNLGAPTTPQNRPPLSSFDHKTKGASTTP